jgi:hypothetical protein
MKKILLLSAVLLGAITASQAGVRFSIGIPIPAPPVVVAPPAYVQPAPTYVEPAPDYYAPPDYYYAQPPVVIGPPVLDLRFGHEPYWQHFRDQFRYRHDRDDYFRGYHRYYDRDYNRGYHHDNDRHDYDRDYRHRR